MPVLKDIWVKNEEGEGSYSTVKLRRLLSHKLCNVQSENSGQGHSNACNCFCSYLGNASLPLTRNCSADFIQLYFSCSGNHGSILLL